MKNLHMVPINVQDLADKLNQNNIRENELQNYILRLEAIRDYCSQSIVNFNNKTKLKINNRK